MSRFRDARLQLRWASQPAAAVGRTLLPHRDDFSEESLQWSAALGAQEYADVGFHGALEFPKLI